jgi:hypothetical protein
MRWSSNAVAGRFEILVDEGVPRGDLYDLEQSTYYRVVDRLLNQVLMTFEGRTEASLSRETGLWDEYRFFGVQEVNLAPDEKSVCVKYHDGREESVPLPE